MTTNGKRYETANQQLRRAWEESIRSRLCELEREVEEAVKHIKEAREKLDRLKEKEDAHEP